MKFLSLFGQEEFYMAVLPFLYWCLDASTGIRIAFMLVLSGAVSHWLKVFFALPRPYWVDARVKGLATEATFGFPSGHAQNSASMWGLLAALQKQRWLKWLLVLVIFLIGISRLYLGVHYLSDVLAGWLVGWLLVVAFLKLQRPVSAWIARSGVARLILASALISALLILITLAVYSLRASWILPAEWAANAAAAGDLPDPINLTNMITLAGTWFGLAGAGAWYYKKYGLPKPGKDLKNNFFRYAVGVAGVAVLWFGLGAIFPRTADLLSYLLRFFRYALVGAWVSAAAPLIFARLKLD